MGRVAGAAGSARAGASAGRGLGCRGRLLVTGAVGRRSASGRPGGCRRLHGWGGGGEAGGREVLGRGGTRILTPGRVKVLPAERTGRGVCWRA